MDKIKIHVLRTGEVRASLQWIREQSLSPLCVASLATHDTDVEPHVIEL